MTSALKPLGGVILIVALVIAYMSYFIVDERKKALEIGRAHV